MFPIKSHNLRTKIDKHESAGSKKSQHSEKMSQNWKTFIIKCHNLAKKSPTSVNFCCKKSQRSEEKS